MRKILMGVLIALVLAVAGFYALSNARTTGYAVADVSAPEVKTFVVDSAHLRFYIDGVENPDMRVKLGDRVRVEFTSSEGFHDWVVDEFGAATERVRPGNSTSVEFVADKQGTFEYYCSVGQHRANGMKGNFIVE